MEYVICGSNVFFESNKIYSTHFLGGLIKALLPNVVLQVVHLLCDGVDSISETEIIPFSVVIKSGAGSIAQAAGSGGFTLGAGGVETQPTLASSNVITKSFDSGFGICQFSGVFGVKGGGVALAYLHIRNSLRGQA
ncbi:protein of unknown function DUF5971 [Flyfo siphovirus Tbat2_3]|nr:protein of unknown function DUF5971 [Flyfo siphovirus Tbat2_3]